MLTSSNICFVLPHILCILIIICQAFLGPLGARMVFNAGVHRMILQCVWGLWDKSHHSSVGVFTCSHCTHMVGMLQQHTENILWHFSSPSSPTWNKLISGALSHAAAPPLSVLLFPSPRINLFPSKNLKWQQDAVVTLLLQVWWLFYFAQSFILSPGEINLSLHKSWLYNYQGWKTSCFALLAKICANC